MRRIIIICLGWLLINSCKEEDTAQGFKIDNIAPGMLTNVTIQNIPGGAKINYKLPNDNDILYVEANYQTADGAKKNIKSSFNQNTLTVEGFAEQRDYPVQIYVVDKSGNKSQVSKVTIKPLEPPIQLMTKSLSMSPDFGGVRFKWQNETKTPMALLVFGRNNSGEEILIDSYYSDSEVGEYVLRGQKSVAQDFTVVVRDKWDNISKRITQKITPIFETKLDTKRFVDLGATFKKNITDGLSLCWDGLTEDNIASNATVPWTGAFDLGTEAKLSRVKIWQYSWSFNDYGHYYAGGNARVVNIYGSMRPSPSGALDQSWTLLKSCEIVKPSGLPIGIGRGMMSEEDFDLAKNRGHEFIIPLEAASVRYIRVEVTKAWETTLGAFSELELFGAPLTN